MTEDEIYQIALADPINAQITKTLGKTDLLDNVIEILTQLDANDFKEINPNGLFKFDDIPIPYNELSSKQDSKTSFSPEMYKQFENILEKINQDGTNKEYPFIISTEPNSNEYSNIKSFSEGKRQSCSYDWNFIEDYIKNSDQPIKLSLLHTHPNPLGIEFQTLYNKYPDKLAQLGVKPDGLNISLADVFTAQHLQELAEKHKKNIETESTILLFDGTLISFSTNNAVFLTNKEKITTQNKTNNMEKVPEM